MLIKHKRTNNISWCACDHNKKKDKINTNKQKHTKQNTHVKNKIQKKKDEFKFGARIGKKNKIKGINKDNQ